MGELLVRWSKTPGDRSLDGWTKGFLLSPHGEYMAIVYIPERAELLVIPLKDLIVIRAE